jgi:hypothetical protein
MLPSTTWLVAGDLASRAVSDMSSFAADFHAFLQAMNEQAPPVDGSLRTRVRDHLGVDPGSLPVIGEEVAIYNRVNLQLALDAWAQGEGRAIEPIGFGAPNRWMGVELGDLLGRSNPTGRGIDIAPVNYTEAELPDGARLRCVEGAVLLITDGVQRFVGLIARAQQRSAGPPPFILQIAAVDQDAVSGLLSELRRLRHELNVYRGRVVAVMRGDRHNLFDGQLNLAYVESTLRERDDVILAAGVLERIERHTIEFSRHIDRLRALGRGVRRGLLLYGPPGTGKTHTVSYLASALAGRTTFIITGASFGMLPPICRLARELAPSMVVLEDVDLVALERTMPGQGANPLLFELMNEMDGVGSDTDIIFLLTTNRADLLEPALAARPGRVDLAIEIARPDPLCRRRLIELYGHELSLSTAVKDSLVDRTEGVSAAFIKELLRRSALLAVTHDDAETTVVSDTYVDAALEELLLASDELTRALLGARHDGDDPGRPDIATALRRGRGRPSGA